MAAPIPRAAPVTRATRPAEAAEPESARLSANSPSLSIDVLEVHVVLDGAGGWQIVIAVDQHAAEPGGPGLLPVERAVQRVDRSPTGPLGVSVQRHRETLSRTDEIEVSRLALAADHHQVVLAAGTDDRRADAHLRGRRMRAAHDGGVGMAGQCGGDLGGERRAEFTAAELDHLEHLAAGAAPDLFDETLVRIAENGRRRVVERDHLG